MKRFLQAQGAKLVVLGILLTKIPKMSDPVSEIGYGLLALLVISVIIFIHELGHALFYVWRGVGIAKFSVGFGRPVYSFYYKGTKIQLGWIPAGGFVMPCSQFLLDEMDEAELNEIKEQHPSHYQLIRDENKFPENRSAKDRLWGVVGGPLASYAFGLVCVFAVFVYKGQPDQLLPRFKLVVTEVAAQSQAEKVGIQVGDEISDLKGFDWHVANWEVSKREEELHLFVENQESKKTLTSSEFQVGANGDKYILIAGAKVQPRKMLWTKLSLTDAAWKSLKVCTSLFFLGMLSPIFLAWQMFAKLDFSSVTEGGGGPVGILMLISGVISQGWPTVIVLTGILSVVIGGLNSFPGMLGIKKAHPLLDGGKILYEISQLINGEKNTLALWTARVVTPIMILIIVVVLADLLFAIF